MIITTPALDEIQLAIDSFKNRELSYAEQLKFDKLLDTRADLITELALFQNVERREIVRARLGIK